MAGEYFLTVGDQAQLPQVLKGEFLKGHPEPRIAMVGRSNVGKSSLINSLLGEELARVSKQPGKTRHIHCYFWKEARRVIVDLPGYGFAKASKDDRNVWATFINAYLQKDENLAAALVLLDSRHGPTDVDAEAIRFLSLKNIPVIFVFTKVDQLKNQSETVRRMREGNQALADWGIPAEATFWVSVKTKDGLKQLIDAIS